MTLYFLIGIALFALILISDNSENRALQWIGSIIPPLPLFYLVYVRVDLFTSLIWLVALIVFLYSIVRLIISLVDFKHSPSKLDWLRKLIRPTLAIIAITVSQIAISLSVTSANEYAINQALLVQSKINADEACPLEIEGWATEKHRRTSSNNIHYGKYGTKYLISYKCNPETLEYAFDVRINHDESFHISGGQKQKVKVTYGDFANQTMIYIDNNTDLKALASRDIEQPIRF